MQYRRCYRTRHESSNTVTKKFRYIKGNPRISSIDVAIDMDRQIQSPKNPNI